MISVYYQIRFAKHPTNPNVVGDDLYIVEVDAKPEGDPWCLRTEKEAVDTIRRMHLDKLRAARGAFTVAELALREAEHRANSPIPIHRLKPEHAIEPKEHV